MNYRTLKREGTMIATVDATDNGLYLYTVEGWIHGGKYYIHEYHPNTLRYTGETFTKFVCDQNSYSFKSCVFYFDREGCFDCEGCFDHSDLTEEGLKIFPGID